MAEKVKIILQSPTGAFKPQTLVDDAIPTYPGILGILEGLAENQITQFEGNHKLQAELDVTFYNDSAPLAPVVLP